MSLKMFKVVGIFGVLIFCFLFHFIYSWFPNTLFSILFPVNESIWEHMKLIMSSFLFYGIIEYFLLKKNNIYFNNYITSVFLSGVLGIAVFLLIYLPLYDIFGENIFLNISLLLIVICICELISFNVLKSEKYSYFEYISLIGIMFVYILFAIHTYFPIINGLFYDNVHGKYGINLLAK